MYSVLIYSDSTRLPPSQSYHDSSEPSSNENDISRDLSPTRQPYHSTSINVSGVKPAVNGYDSHSRQFSTSSSEGTRNERTREPAPFVGGTWKPPGTQVASSRPAGFRSVKPPQHVTSMDIKTATPVNDSRSDEGTKTHSGSHILGRALFKVNKKDWLDNVI